MILSVYDRLGFLGRIIDNLEPAQSLSFDDLYCRWQRANYFVQVRELGLLLVCYKKNDICHIDDNCQVDENQSNSFNVFDASSNKKNRHQALALS